MNESDLYLNEKSLNFQSKEELNKWKSAGFQLPEFDRDAVKKETDKAPRWVHFGSGNIFRGFPAVLQQKLLNTGLSKTGIIAAEAFDFEIIEKIYKPHDDLGVLVILKSDGSIEKCVVASVTQSLIADKNYNLNDWKRLESVFSSPSLQMVSFTITEKGYNPLPQDLCSPASVKSCMGKITALCMHRYEKGGYPVALVSMDNCSHNGSRLQNAVIAIAESWESGGNAPAGFCNWLKDSTKVSFPWSMIDKITPRPDADVKKMLEDSGFKDTEIVVTSKNTWIAPFVNAEETQYLVVEDSFPNGRPPLEKAGLIFTDRNTVDRAEKMKVCTCLNPLHTALAVYGCLLGYVSIHEEMHNSLLVNLINRLGYIEGLPVVTNPEIISPEVFLKQVLEVRLPNPFMPDTPQRIACDTSQKIPVRFGETLKALKAKNKDDIDKLISVPLVFAGWLRYLLGIDDNGNTFAPSSDPMLEKLQPIVSKAFEVRNDIEEVKKVLYPLLSDSGVFGINLTETSLAEKVCNLFIELSKGNGAVSKTLEKYIA